jgi:hypothetical protein
MMKTLLETVSKAPDNASDSICHLWSELENARQNTLVLFIMQTCRPRLQLSFVRDSVIDPSPRNFGPDPPSIDEMDEMDMETFVDNLDALAAAAMRSVTQEVSAFAYIRHHVHRYSRIFLLP